jgi:hypothetical protein
MIQKALAKQVLAKQALGDSRFAQRLGEAL